MKYTEAVGFARQSADNPRILEGMAIPYGVVSNLTDLDGRGTVGREAWAPGAFAADVAAWTNREDGRRAPFRPRHGAPAIASVTFMDTPSGVAFRTSVIRDTEAGNAYLADVADGLNGVSIEGMWSSKPTPMKDGTVLHRSGRLHGLAGSDNPAYDGAHVALRDMEDAMAAETEPTPTPEPEPTPTPEPEPTPVGRSAVTAQRDAVLSDPIVHAAPIRVTRAEAVYGPQAYQANGERPRFLRDLIAQRAGDAAASERLDRHYRQLDELALAIERASDVLVAEIPGMYPTEFMPGLLTPRILKGRPMGSFFNRVTIADARPRTFAKVTTSGSVATAADGVALTATDVATTAVTVTPAIYGTYTDISRAAFDGGDPSTEQMVINDLVEGYAQASEAVIKTAVEAGATASGVAVTAATPWAGELANVINYYSTRFRPATGIFVPSALFSVLLAQGDTTGRPFMPLLNPTNADGSVAAGAVSGSILNATAYLSYASTANVNVFARPEDYVIYESAVARFTFSEVVGPTSVRVGIWAYLAVGTRLGGLKVTAA